MNPGIFCVKLDKSPLFMDSMMKSIENMEILTHGNTVPKSSTTYLSEPLLMEKLSASTEVSVPKSKPSTKSELSIEKLKSHTKGLSAT